MSAEGIFWCAAVVVFYTYAGYPLLLKLATLVHQRPVKRAAIVPSVSLLIAAYNEEDVIDEKVRNALALDYPADCLTIVVVSDGSTDQTNRIVEQHAGDDRIRLFAYPLNRGKVAAINDTIEHLDSEIVVFSDASSMLAEDALRALVASFADPEIGVASGIYRVRKKGEAELGEQEDFYWKYETFLKVHEAKLGSVLGAHGSLYGIRRRLYPYPAPGTINDDYVIPVRILQKGYRTGYETAAVAYEEAREMGGFSRRVRVMAGNFEQLREIGALLLPPRWFPLFVFLSHKAARLIVPVGMVALFVVNALLLDRTFYLWSFCAQIAFYALAVVGALVRYPLKLLKLPYYFCMINVAAFIAFYYTCVARRVPAWKR